MVKLLFLNRDKGGVNYFRTETPAIQLQNDYSNDFDITLKNSFKDESIENIIDELSGYDIIHYHRTFVNDIEKNTNIINTLKNNGTTLILDIDDYWELDKTHPLYQYSLKINLKGITISNLINVDHVTTTTDIFAHEIRKYNKNVTVLKNGVNSQLLPQYRNNNKKDRDIVNITYVAGSSHLNDLTLLNGVVNLLNSDMSLKNKFRIILAGFDINGTINERVVNPDFIKAIKILNLYNNNFITKMKKFNGDITKIKEIPQQIKEVFKDKVYINKQRDIKPNESVYYKYEAILTDNGKLLNNDREYINYLNKFTKEKYIKEHSVNYIRRWTAKPNEYAKVLDETDILIAPLVDNKFNNLKSNLKQVEAATRKLPIVCSDVLPYNVDGINDENCILIKPSKNQQRDWARSLKKLILDKDYRERIGNKLYDDLSLEYNLVNVTEKRVELYKTLVSKNEMV